MLHVNEAMLDRGFISDQAAAVLSKDQIRQIKNKYNLIDLSSEEEETLMQDLSRMGILMEEDWYCCSRSGGNIFESLKKQVSADINLLYKMAITGRYSRLHIENIKSQQKVLNVLEQLLTE